MQLFSFAQIRASFLRKMRDASPFSVCNKWAFGVFSLFQLLLFINRKDMDGIGLSDFAGTGLELFKKVSAFAQVHRSMY
jgi:hypothetical protein